MHMHPINIEDSQGHHLRAWFSPLPTQALARPHPGAAPTPLQQPLGPYPGAFAGADSVTKKQLSATKKTAVRHQKNATYNVWLGIATYNVWLGFATYNVWLGFRKSDVTKKR